jgi:hypothetical protein
MLMGGDHHTSRLHLVVSSLTTSNLSRMHAV